MDDTVISPGKLQLQVVISSIYFRWSYVFVLQFVLGNKMVDSASESDSSSLDGGAMLPPNTVSRDQLQKRIESLQQQNR